MNNILTNHDNIDLSIYLILSYPSSFIDQQSRKFLSEYLSWSSFLPLINDEKQYYCLYNKLMNEESIPRTSQIIQNCDNLDNNILRNHTSDIQSSTTKPTSCNTKTNNKSNSKIKKLILHYKHEKRFQSFKRDMHTLYEDIFKNTPAADMAFIVGNYNRRNATHQLIRKKPKQALLHDKIVPSTYERYTNKNTRYL